MLARRAGSRHPNLVLPKTPLFGMRLDIVEDHLFNGVKAHFERVLEPMGKNKY